MSKWNWDRIAPASGIVFVGLYIAAAVLISLDQPTLGDPNRDWVAWVHDHRRELKAAAILFGLALFAFLWFVGSLADALRRGSEERLAAVATAAGAAGVGIAVAGAALAAALAYRIAAEAPALTKSLWEVQLVAFTLINFVGAALMYTAVASSWRSRLFPRWYAWLASLGALAVLFAGGALTYNGFYAPDGAYGLIATVVFMVWVIVTSVLLIQQTGRTEASAALASSP